MIKFTQSSRKFLFTGEIIGPKIHQKSKYVNDVMSSKSDKARQNVLVSDKIYSK